MIRRVLAASLFFALGFLAGIIFSPEGDLADTFFDFKLIEIANLVVALAIGYWVTYRINKRLGNEDKLREFVSSQVDEYLGKITNLYEQAVIHMSDPSLTTGTKV